MTLFKNTIHFHASWFSRNFIFSSFTTSLDNLCSHQNSLSKLWADKFLTKPAFAVTDGHSKTQKDYPALDGTSFMVCGLCLAHKLKIVKTYFVWCLCVVKVNLPQWHLQYLLKDLFNGDCKTPLFLALTFIF